MKNGRFVAYVVTLVVAAATVLVPLSVFVQLAAIVVELSICFIVCERLRGRQTETAPADELLPVEAPSPENEVVPHEQKVDTAEASALADRIGAVAREGLASTGVIAKSAEATEATKIGESFEKFNSVTKTISENVLKTFNISDNLSNSAKQAFDLSEQVRSGIESVMASLSVSIKDSEALFEQSQMIQRIVDLMSDISSKTHVLSINASIVSARSGKEGKAFDVVAREIRGLAQETESSLSEIEKVIHDVQTNINSVVQHAQSAQEQTEQERQSLISVAGSLQGAILAVEVIRTVTNATQEIIETQTSSLRSLEEQMNVLIERSGTVDKYQDLCSEITGAFSTLEQIGLQLRGWLQALQGPSPNPSAGPSTRPSASPSASPSADRDQKRGELA